MSRDHQDHGQNVTMPQLVSRRPIGMLHVTAHGKDAESKVCPASNGQYTGQAGNTPAPLLSEAM
jgi:hypothetical protein